MTLLDICIYLFAAELGAGPSYMTESVALSPLIPFRLSSSGVDRLAEVSQAREVKGI